MADGDTLDLKGIVDYTVQIRRSNTTLYKDRRWQLDADMPITYQTGMHEFHGNIPWNMEHWNSAMRR
jgi:hypothetical protein